MDQKKIIHHFGKVNLTLEFSGFEPIKHSLVDDRVTNHLVRELISLEKGEVVNMTEKRSVDHYNLRMKEEVVPGKSLGESMKQWKEVHTIVNEALTSGDFEDVIINGIGGSILGPYMMKVALHGPDFPYRKKGNKRPKIHFLSNTDPDSFHELMECVDLSKTILVTMSKSGGTPETMTNFRVFNEILKSRNLPLDLHNMTITTKNSKLFKLSEEMKLGGRCFLMNAETGGRTSVGSAIGMVPAAFSGLDFAAFLEGQSAMDELSRIGVIEQNPALLLSLQIHILTKKVGHKNMVVLGYSDFLREYAHYLQQLYMESLGKEFGVDGFPIYEGQTVFGGVGTSEQHAFMQQIQKGISDCFVRFLYFRKRTHDFTNDASGSMGRQLLGFLKGTEFALQQNGKPFITSKFEERSMFTLGAMIALEERIVTFLGLLKKINAYDQPGVEGGKKSANRMNEVSLTVEKMVLELISGQQQWEGSSKEFQEKMEHTLKNFELDFIDACLDDIDANLGVEGSYPLLFGKVKVTRSWRDGRTGFVYRIEKL